MSTKDFAELLVDNLIAAAVRYADSNPSDDFHAVKLEAREKYRRDVIQALRVPSPPSEDLPTVHDRFMFAAVQGQIAYQGLEGCGSDEGCKDVAVWAKELADACMKTRRPA